MPYDYIGELCNGSTAAFEAVSPGSNPGSPAKLCTPTDLGVSKILYCLAKTSILILQIRTNLKSFKKAEIYLSLLLQKKNDPSFTSW